MNNSDHRDRLESKLQIVITDTDGKIQESDQRIFSLKIDRKLGDFHPFFMDIGSHIPKGLSNTFTCITLDIEEDTYIADIEV